jgi:F-type H+-transporting ATPase subunit epsilon
LALELVIVTPQGEAYSGTVDQAVLPGAEGNFGVLEQHERFLAPLKHGAIEIRTSAGSQWAAVSQGFADVSAEKIVVLADYCALAKDINVARVREERAETEAELAALHEVLEHEARRAELSEILTHAQIRIEVGEKHH